MPRSRPQDSPLWQRAERLSIEITAILATPGFQRERNLRIDLARACQQLRRALADGLGRARGPDAVDALRKARERCGEVRTLVAVAASRSRLEPDTCSRLVTMTDELSRLLATQGREAVLRTSDSA
jgi:four helix bundle protein